MSADKKVSGNFEIEGRRRNSNPVGKNKIKMFNSSYDPERFHSVCCLAAFKKILMVAFTFIIESWAEPLTYPVRTMGVLTGQS